ncbi:hypothetical protein [Rhodopseudomonas sp. AAP120]|uniref:hypothetical protein n=1 Tax=Rhodopseudomonas sp. AAP120 TaxID=1523430 RepID=UPI0006B96FB7|nr:hypothetical protein [Rhodopseudomonas sp. AAP120]
MGVREQAVRRGGDWRSRVARWLGLTLGVVAVATGARAGASSELDERGAAQQIPEVWIDFGRRLQERIQQRLTSESEAANRLLTSMQSRATDPGAPPTIVVRVWVTADGAVERVELEGSPSEDERRDLAMAIRDAGAIGAAPAAMPQPLRMKLSLAAQPMEQAR